MKEDWIHLLSLRLESTNWALHFEKIWLMNSLDLSFRSETVNQCWDHGLSFWKLLQQFPIT